MSIIHFIGGEKGGVGKSVVARLVTQHCIDHSLPFSALDADGSHGTLRRYYGEYTQAVDLGSLESADGILTTAVSGERRVIVDLPSQSERALGAWLTEGGVFELARESHCKIVFWHILDDSKDAVTSLGRLLERYGDHASYVVVKNLGRGKDFSFFDQSPQRAKAEALGAKVIELPELAGSAMQKIDRIDASFWAAVHNKEFGGDTLTRMDRQRTKVWLQAAADQLARAADVV